MMEDQALDQARPFRGGLRSLDGDLERFNDPPVLNSRRTGGFTGPAVETEIKVVANLGTQADPTVRDGPHQVNSTSRAIVLVRSLDVSGTARGAKSAMNAVLITAIVNLS